MSTQTFTKDEPVWFISKFGDRVTGTYVEQSEAPTLDGPRMMHVVSSHNAFGAHSEEATECMVPLGKLNKGH